MNTNATRIFSFLTFLVAFFGTNWNVSGLLLNPSYANDSSIVVVLDKVEVVNTDREASVVQIGNPEIADINVASATTILVLGISLGETNLLLIDDKGKIIQDLNVVVVREVDQNQITVHQGPSTTRSLRCDPTCTEGDPSVGPESGASNATTTSP